MAENDRPLPNPPRTRFGRQVSGGEEGAGPLAADRLAQAAAEGRLDEVLEHEIPEGEHARTLAMMMLGMSGMMPGAGMPSVSPVPAQAPGAMTVAAADSGLASTPPPEVLAATMEGDVAGLMSLLRAEHERRGGSPGSVVPPPSVAGEVSPSAAVQGGEGPRAGIDQVIVDELIRVAADNQVTVDWLLLRAVKLYVEEYRRTGRL